MLDTDMATKNPLPKSNTSTDVFKKIRMSADDSEKFSELCDHVNMTEKDVMSYLVKTVRFLLEKKEIPSLTGVYEADWLLIPRVDYRFLLEQSKGYEDLLVKGITAFKMIGWDWRVILSQWSEVNGGEWSIENNVLVWKHNVSMVFSNSFYEALSQMLKVEGAEIIWRDIGERQLIIKFLPKQFDK